MKTQRFTVTAETNATYYQMPRWLMQYAADKYLCCESVVLYTIMLDRVRMSRANGWQNENGEVYIYFKREQMMQLLNCKKDKLSRVLRELVNNNLLDLEKGGMYHASRLYLRYPDAQEYKPVVKHSENSVISQTEYPVNNPPETDAVAMSEFDEGADFPSSDVGFSAYMMSENRLHIIITILRKNKSIIIKNHLMWTNRFYLKGLYQTASLMSLVKLVRP